MNQKGELLVSLKNPSGVCKGVAMRFTAGTGPTALSAATALVPTGIGTHAWQGSGLKRQAVETRA